MKRCCHKHSSLDLEEYILVALRSAAATYTRNKGRFLPYAEQIMREALVDYRKLRNSATGVPKLDTHGHCPPKYNSSAWRRGFIARGVVF